MKPIGQTFFVKEPPPPIGVDGVFLTKIEVFFKQKSSTLGIEMQIRQCENGLPTSSRLPFATKLLQASDVTTSSDASSATAFVFDTPVFLQSNKLYAFVLVPVGGNPDYLVWSGQISDTDVTTNSPIYTNNDTGDLFLSSNDLSWTPVYNEDIKFNLYIANFTSTSGSAYFLAPDEEWLQYKDPIGNFYPREQVLFGNAQINCVSLSIAANSGAFSVGDTVYQANASSIVSGIVYGANSTVLRIRNATGAFSNTSAGVPLLYNANAAANASVNVVSQSIITTASNTTIIMPDTSLLSANDKIYIQTNNKSTTKVANVNSITNSTAIVVNVAPTFSDSAAMIGKLIYNGKMYGKFSGGAAQDGFYSAVLDKSSANTTVNLANNGGGVQIIGGTSGATATLTRVRNARYDTMTPQFITMQYSNTEIDFSFKGFHNDETFTADGSWITVENGKINEFTDYKRVAMSRSLELTQLPFARIGNSSVTIKTDLFTANTKISPVIDSIRQTVTFTNNILREEWELKGFRLNYVANSAVRVPQEGETITITALGNTATGIVWSSNTSVINVTNVTGTFVNTSFTASGGGTGLISSATEFGEAFDVNLKRSSRYISKNVILREDQDSEDIRTVLTAYRPAGTNWLVYAKIINTADNDPFSTKHWSRLTELSSPSLLSSTVNIDDLVELQYGFPESALLYSNGQTVSSSSNAVSMTSTTGLRSGDFVYLKTATAFNVRKVIYVTNSTSITVDRAPSFSNTDTSMGIIPGLESTAGAFKYDQNDGIVRYCSLTDGVYDRYIQFAIKLVPVGTSSIIVPRSADVQVLAMQI